MFAPAAIVRGVGTKQPLKRQAGSTSHSKKPSVSARRHPFPRFLPFADSSLDLVRMFQQRLWVRAKICRSIRMQGAEVNSGAHCPGSQLLGSSGQLSQALPHCCTGYAEQNWRRIQSSAKEAAATHLNPIGTAGLKAAEQSKRWLQKW